MGRYKLWKDDEIKYLIDNWGVKSIKAISRNLNRSEDGIVNKATRLKLSRKAYQGELITLNQLLVGLGKEKSMSHYKTKFSKLGFPFENTKRGLNDTRELDLVDIERFWVWCEKNQHSVDFASFEEGMLGVEPKWAKEKRTHDIKKKRKIIDREWTKAEDKLLIDLLHEYKYSYRELEKILKRTSSAIYRRIFDLGEKARPLREDPHSTWTDTQKNILEDMVRRRQSYCFMVDAIGKSEKAIRGKVYSLYKSENLDKAANFIERKMN